MTRQQALREARRRWGKHAVIRYRHHANRAAARERARVELQAHRAAKPSPLTSEWRRIENELRGAVIAMPCSVGHLVAGLAFMVEGEGDSWQEAFDKVDAKDLVRRRGKEEG